MDRFRYEIRHFYSEIYIFFPFQMPNSTPNVSKLEILAQEVVKSNAMKENHWVRSMK